MSATRTSVAAMVLVGGLIAPGLYWWQFGRVASVAPTEAKRMLGRRGDSTVLVDVRPTGEYEHRHIDGAQHWPMADILGVRSRDDVPRRFRDKKLLLVCVVGVLSTQAAEHLGQAGLSDVFNVRGGIQAWIGVAAGPERERYARWRTGSGKIVPFPFRRLPAWEQFLAVASGFGMKAAYTVLSLILAIVLWRSRAPDLVALRWAMIFFFLGENCCAINYWVFGEESYLLEYLHSYGMALCFAFATYAATEALDARLIRMSGPAEKCAALGLCTRCAKYGDAPCGLKRTFYLILPAMMVLAAMLLTSGRHEVSYNVMIYGTSYHYVHPYIFQLFETAFCPVAAMALFAVSMGILLFKKVQPLPAAKVAFAAGAGALGFGTLRMVLLGAYHQNMMWFVFWEEATELVFIVGVCFLLWVFRRQRAAVR